MTQRSGFPILQNAFDISPSHLAILDESFCFVLVNDAFVRDAGRDRNDLIGTSYFDVFPGTVTPETLRKVLESGTEHVIIDQPGIQSAADDDRSYWDRQYIPMNAEAGRRSILVIFQDVTETKEREVELETLLVEMNHRIKNNLASVEALARVELYAESKTKEAAIDDIISRINAIGQVHQTLYETASYASVRIERYLRELLEALIAGGSAGECSYRLNLEVEDLAVSSKVATKLGLMLAELTTNTIKYAAASGVVDIYVRLYQEGDNVFVTYYDSGDAFPESVSSLDDLGTGTGVPILQALITDLDGTISLDASVRPPIFVISYPVESGR